jgi:translation initiation factor 2B subunit (eIF-2B alpha/beta/delta family)
LDPQVLREIELIKADRWKGASQLAREALRVVKLAAERYSPPKAADAGDYLGYLKQVGRLLMEARPSMAALANSVGFLLHQLLEKGKTEPPFSLRAFALSKAEELIRQSEEASAGDDPQLQLHGSTGLPPRPPSWKGGGGRGHRVSAPLRGNSHSQGSL